MEDDDVTFFVQIQKIIDFIDENYLEVRYIPLAIEELGVKTLFLNERNPHVDFLGIEKYLFSDGKLDVDFGPSMEIKTPYLKKMHDFVGKLLCNMK